MIKITGHLDLRKHDSYRWYLLPNRKLLTDDGLAIESQRGFVLDGGSIPKSLWSLSVPPLGSDADEGFFWHDCLYAWHRDHSPFIRVNREVTRKEADQLMMALHLQEGVSQELAEAMYAGVRLGASRSWMSPKDKLDSGIITELPEYYDQ